MNRPARPRLDRPPVYTNARFFDLETCRRVRAAMAAGAAEAAAVLTDGIAEDETVRLARLVDVDAAVLADVEARLDDERSAVAGTTRFSLGVREGASFIRYSPGGFYLPHVDRAEDREWPDAAHRRVSVVVFLNDDFTGGALHLIDAGTVVTPRAGLLVAFDAALLHEVEPVRNGTREVVVDWFLDGPAEGPTGPASSR